MAPHKTTHSSPSDGGDTVIFDGFDSVAPTGTVVHLGGGVFEYDTAGAFESLDDGDFVEDTFTYTIRDGNGGTATGTVSITVTGVNDAPAPSPTVAPA